MKKVAVLLLTGATMVATSAQADTLSQDVREVTDDGVHIFNTFKPAGVRAEVGTQGYGGALVYSASPSVDIEAGFASAEEIKLIDDLKVEDNKYSVKFDPNKNAFLNAKLRPFKNSFHVTTGILWQDNKMTLSAKDAGPNGKITVDGKDYTTSSVGDVKASLNFKNEVAPYLGIGFSPSITQRWGLFGEIGAAYVGGSDITVTSNKNRNNIVEATDENGNTYKLDGTNGTDIKTVGSVLDEAQREIDKKDLVTEVLPVAKLGLTFRF